MVRAIQVDQELTEDQYLDVLNDLYGTVEVCGMTMDSGRVLREMDPVAFRCGKADYEDGLDKKYECDDCHEVFDDEDKAEECCAPTVDDVSLGDDGTMDTVATIKGKTFRYGDTSEYRDETTGDFTKEGWREFAEMVLEDYLADEVTK